MRARSRVPACARNHEGPSWRPVPVHSAEVELQLGSAAVAAAVARAIAVEMAETTDHATVHCTVEGPVVRARITARDLSGLRAAMTGFIRLCDAGAGAAAQAG